MGFINIFFVSFLCTLSLLSTGRLFNKLIIKKKDENFFESLIYGFIFISFFSLLLNFFTSLNQQLNSVIIIILLIIYFLISRKHLKTDLIILLIISFLSVLIWWEINSWSLKFTFQVRACINNSIYFIDL